MTLFLRKIISTSLIGALMLSSLVYAQEDVTLDDLPSNSAQIIRDFQDAQEKKLFYFLPFNNVSDIGDLIDIERKLENLENIVDRVETGRAQVEVQHTEISYKAENFEEILNQIKMDLATTNRTIIRLKGSIAKHNDKIIDLLDDIRKTERKIEENRETLMKYVQYMYTQGDSIFGAQNEMDVFRTIILNDQDTSETLGDVYSKELISVTGQSIVEENRLLVAINDEHKRDLQESKNRKRGQQNRLNELRKKLQVQRAYQSKILSITKKREKVLAQNLTKMSDHEQRLLRQIEAASRQYNETFGNLYTENGCYESNRNIGDCAQIELYYEAEKELRNKFFGRGEPEFAWPILPKEGISVLFKDPSYTQKLGEFHYGIDIPSPQGTDILAPADAYVLAVAPPREGSYSFVALKHTDGFVTVYGHISETAVRKFDYIPAGTVFAKTGGQIGRAGSGPLTTGPHLHFEMYKDRAAIDPLRHLNLTYMHVSKVDRKYGHKFIEDFRETYGDRVDVDKIREEIDFFWIEGDTELERQKAMLEKYAVPVFKDQKDWIEAATYEAIDPSFIMCIGLAESALGNRLKSAYNIGNVGNNDSGDVRYYEGPVEGIQAIAKVLNNEHLGGYQTLDRLSGWGNTDGLKYATSKYNWHNNMLKCLSSLKGEFIDDDFEFRITEMSPTQYLEQMRLKG